MQLRLIERLKRIHNSIYERSCAHIPSNHTQFNKSEERDSNKIKMNLFFPTSVFCMILCMIWFPEGYLPLVLGMFNIRHYTVHYPMNVILRKHEVFHDRVQF